MGRKRAKSTSAESGWSLPEAAYLKQRGGDGVVRSCCGTLKAMILGCEGGFVGSTY